MNDTERSLPPRPLVGEALAELTAALAETSERGGRIGADAGAAFGTDLRARLEAFLARHGHTDEPAAAYQQALELLLRLLTLAEDERLATAEHVRRRAAELGGEPNSAA